MSSLDRIKERFNMFYSEINTQMGRLKNSDSILSQLSMKSDDAKLFNSMEKSGITEVDQLIKTAKQFDVELKSYIEKNSLKKKVAQRKTKTASLKSKFPPIWNDDKLNRYIESIIDEVFDQDEQIESEKSQHPVRSLGDFAAASTSKTTVKPILKTHNLKTSKRNVSTNVKFQIHSTKPVATAQTLTKSSKNNNKAKACIQIQTLITSNETLFPCRSERTMNTVNSDDAVIENFKAPSKTNTIQAASSILNYSPITVTSTTGHINNTKPHNQHDVDIIDSNLATVRPENTKQMTTLVLPVLSIKGSCSIQKIYQLEICSERDGKTLLDKSSEEHPMNTKFAEFVYEAPFKSTAPAAIQSEAPFKNHPKPDDDKATNENPSNLFDIRDVNRILNDYGVHLRDGKIHFFMESSLNRKGNKKTKLKKSLKPSKLRKSVDDELKVTQSEVEDNESRETKINICATDDAAKQKRENEINEKDSSMSSSITDDGKILQILKINRDGERCSRRSLRRNSSSESYPPSSRNNESSVQPQIPIADVKRSVAENFQSIYKLIEDTFQPNDGAEPTAEIIENEKEIDDGMNEMRAVIKMSEENIRRAGRLLGKYQAPNESTSNEKIMKHCTKLIEKSTGVSSNMDIREEIHANDELVTDGNNPTFKISQPDKLQKIETVESSVQTSEDKIMQTDGNLNWKSQQYFGSVYEKYSNYNHINFNQSPLEAVKLHPLCSLFESCNCVGCERKRNFQTNPMTRQRYSIDSGKIPSQLTSFSSTSVSSPKLSVPYNPIYSDDDEVMKAANRFLRSVEKRKNRNPGSDVGSSEVSSSLDFSPQKVHSRRSSSSTSTPSSSLLNHRTQNDDKHVQRPVSRARNNLENKLQEASSETVSAEQKLEDIERFFKDEQSNNSSSSGLPQLDSPDLRSNQEFRYLSEGEVLSQGETQLGLSDDDLQDFFF